MKDSWLSFLKAISLGVAVSLLEIFIYMFGRLAYSQNAFQESTYHAFPYILYFLSWPVQLFDRVGYKLIHYSHSHVTGNSFWGALFDYMFVNALGWSAVLFLIFQASIKISHILDSKGSSEG